MNISAYILEYLKQFGTVTVPGFGVFHLENSKAIINTENGSILPPSSQIAFTSDYEVQSDELVSFISDQKQTSTESVKNELLIQTDFWKKRLQADLLLEIQNLGTIYIEDGDTHFKGNRLQMDHPDYYGLEEIRISDINTTGIPGKKNVEEDYRFNKSILWAFLFIIPALGLVCLAYTQQELLFGKKSFDTISVQTKTHRIVKDTVKIKKDSAQMKMSDSLKKDSAVVPVAKKGAGNQISKNTKINKWQK
ncbi:hypothetical protein CHRYSEOSP005_08500 [Chryseobacterium sp. Alg-005]|uniref:HU domain-containing protein n=1 Tax=Chryseobacterium sp. Alg-005 TaxID=3159516 RepID=UPI003555AD3C